MPSKTLPLCVILGGGGHARVLLECLHASQLADIYGILDADRTRWGTEMMGVPVCGGDDLLPGLAEEGVTHFIVGQGGIGDNTGRKLLFECGWASGLQPLTIRHPSVICARSVEVGAGAVLFPGAILNPGVVIGRNAIVNTGAILEHDCRIGDHVHIGPGAVLSGTVLVEEGAHIGVGAVVRQEIHVGAWAVVGAGAVVVSDVPASVVVKGVPAR